MRAPAKKAIINIIIVMSASVVVFSAILIMAQNRNLSQSIKDQTTINQRFFRCLILVPPDPSRTVEQRLSVVDKCAEESRLPSGEGMGE